MKLNIAHNRAFKTATLTALASLCLVNCNGGDYGKTASNQADNQKAALLAAKAVNDATAAGLAGSWVCDQAQSEKLYGDTCLTNEQMAISADLSTLTKVMEMDASTPATASAPASQTQCYYTQDSELKLGDSVSSTDFTGTLVLGKHESIDENGSAELDACKNAYASEKVPAQAPTEEKHKNHDKHDHPKAQQANLVNIEFSVQGANGANNELVVKVTKKGGKTITNIYNREEELTLPDPMPSFPASVLPNVVLAKAPVTSVGAPNPLPALPAPALPNVTVAPASEQDAAAAQ